MPRPCRTACLTGLERLAEEPDLRPCGVRRCLSNAGSGTPTRASTGTALSSTVLPQPFPCLSHRPSTCWTGTGKGAGPYLAAGRVRRELVFRRLVGVLDWTRPPACARPRVNRATSVHGRPHMPHGLPAAGGRRRNAARRGVFRGGAGSAEQDGSQRAAGTPTLWWWCRSGDVPQTLCQPPGGRAASGQEELFEGNCQNGDLMPSGELLGTPSLQVRERWSRREGPRTSRPAARRPRRPARRAADLDRPGDRGLHAPLREEPERHTTRGD